MKNTAFLFFLLVLLTSSGNAAGKTTYNFIIIGDQTYYCDQVRVGKAFTRIYIDGNQFFNVPTAIVDAYAEKGAFYEHLPILTKDQDTAGWALCSLLLRMMETDCTAISAIV